jgi:hypothetical protein
MGSLPEMAIKSILGTSSDDVAIGYVDEEDILHLPKDPRIQYLKLEEPELNLNKDSRYQDFNADFFYSIVQLKWTLLERLLESNYKFVVYNDSDVVWVNNPLPSLLGGFESNPHVFLYVQSFTESIDSPRLCMGFAAFRNSPKSLEFISECKKLHKSLFLSNKRIGDDDVVTEMFVTGSYRSEIVELPQSTFPVGRNLNLYSKKEYFPGLTGPKPFIFHANFVIGLTNKILLMNKFLEITDSEIFNKSLKFKIYILAKTIRLAVGRFRRKILGVSIRYK